MKIAAIDVGTNSSRLIIAKNNKGNYQIIKRKLKVTRLGEGVEDNSFLNYKAMQRTIKVLKEFNKDLQKLNIKKNKAIGTSALRNVDNSQEFVDKVYQETGLDLEIISGKKEARLVFKGVKTDLNYKDFVIIDIGGGSTEFIWSEENSISYISLNLGAVRLTEKYIINPEQIIPEKIKNKIRKRILEYLEDLSFEKRNNLNLIGVGGTITTVGAMDLKLREYNSELIHKHLLSLKKIKNWENRVSKLHLKERIKIQGLAPDRADIIFAGMMILKTIMDYIGATELLISERGILFGALEELKYN